MAKEFDVIIYGATGLTGRLVAAYLNRHRCDHGLSVNRATGRNAWLTFTREKSIAGTNDVARA